MAVSGVTSEIVGSRKRNGVNISFYFKALRTTKPTHGAQKHTP